MKNAQVVGGGGWKDGGCSNDFLDTDIILARGKGIYFVNFTLSGGDSCDLDIHF